MGRYDVAVIGAWPAGSAAAYHLARARARAYAGFLRAAGPLRPALGAWAALGRRAGRER